MDTFLIEKWPANEPTYLGFTQLIWRQGRKWNQYCNLGSVADIMNKNSIKNINLWFSICTTYPRYHKIGIKDQSSIRLDKASTTLSLDLCPPASPESRIYSLPEFTGPWNEKPRPLMVGLITLNLHPFHISHLFLNVKWNLPALNFDFQHFYPLKEAKIVVKCEIEMRPAPPHLP